MSEKKYDDDDHRHAEPAAQPADQGSRQIDQRVRHAAALHERAGENEGRDRQQHPVLRAGDQAGGDHFERIAADFRPDNRRGAEREDNRQRQCDEDDEDDSG